jgi:uncharacterized membrane protein
LTAIFGCEILLIRSAFTKVSAGKKGGETMAQETKVGLPKKTVSAICYIPFIGWIAAIFFFLTEKDSVIRYHAFQGSSVEIGGWILRALLTTVFGLFMPVTIAVMALQLYLAVQTYNGKEVILPYLSEFVKKQVSK